MHKEALERFDQSAIRRQLARILSSSRFEASKRYSTFLEFVVEHCIQYPECKLTALDISVECFNRIPDPDDAYVRNIASGVRKSLESYYQDKKNANQLVILLPKVGYIPKFASPMGNYISSPEACQSMDVVPWRNKRSTRATVLILPIRDLSLIPYHSSIGEIIANIVNYQMSRHPDLAVISRLSARVFSSKCIDTEKLKKTYGIDYYVDGYCRVEGAKLKVGLILHELYTFRQIVHYEFAFMLIELEVSIEEKLIEIAICLVDKILGFETKLGRIAPTRDLTSHTLIISGSNLMHCRTNSEFSKAREVLEEAVRRNARCAKSLGLLSLWHMLALFKEDSIKSDNNYTLMQRYSERAAELDGTEPMAYTMLGARHAYFEDDLGAAHKNYDLALDNNSSHVLSLGLKGAAYSFEDSGEEARYFSEKAIALSPFDPALYMYKSILATAADAMDDYVVAERQAYEAYRLNPSHLSSLRLLISSKVNLGELGQAKSYAKELERLFPSFNLKQYSEKHPGAQSEKGLRLIRNLEKAGVRKH